MKTQAIEKVKSFKSMINSCFAYGGALRDTYNFEKYILPYEEKLGSKIFNKEYDKHLKDLQDNYTIEYNTSTDSEGLTYNSLIKNTHNDN